MRVLASLAAGLAALFAASSCASLGDPAVWADGEVRELESGRPIPSAFVLVEIAASGPAPAASDRTNAAGRFAVFQAVERGQRTMPLVARAEGYKPVAFDVPVFQSNSVLFRLALAGSSKESRAEQMAAPPGDGSGIDGSCDSD